MFFNFYNKVKEFINKYRVGELLWLTLCFLIILPGSLVTPVYQGLDASWNIALSLAVRDHFEFGKDFMFTYGPLGMFAAKNTFVWSKWVLLCFELPILITCVFIARFTLIKTGYHVICYLVVPLIFFLLKAGSVIHLITPIFIFFVFYAIDTKSKVALFITAVISVIGFYIKINYGLVLITLFYIGLGFSVLRKYFSVSIATACFFMQAFLLFLLAYLLNVNISGYVISSLHLINAYNDAMYVYIELSHLHLVLGVVVIAFFITGAVLSYQYIIRDLKVILLFFFCGIYLYLLFKNGYVRADAHRYEYFQQCIVPFALVYVWINKELKKIWAFFVILVLVVSYRALADTGKTGPDPIGKITRTDYFKDIFTDISIKNQFKHDGDFEDTIPSEYINQIGKNTVDITPWEISQIHRMGLKYNPRPVIQSYSAYDEYLDTKNYEKYVSPSAPEYIVYSTRTIDRRYPFWDESITKRAFLTHFQLVDQEQLFEKESFFDEEYYLRRYQDVQDAVKKGKLKSGLEHYLSSGRSQSRKPNAGKANGYLLMKRRATPLQLDTLNEQMISWKVNTDYKIPDSENLLYLYAEVKYSAIGKLKRLLFQPPPISVELTYADGNKNSFKAIVPILKTGVLINKSVHNNYETGFFFKYAGEKNMNIVGIKFIAEQGFSPRIKGVIREMKLVNNN